MSHETWDLSDFQLDVKCAAPVADATGAPAAGVTDIGVVL